MFPYERQCQGGRPMRTPQLMCCIVCLLVSLGLTPSIEAQPEPFGARVLKAVTVTITSINYATRQRAQCHGAVFAVIRGAAVKSAAYIMTAKHCVESLSSAPLQAGTRWKDIREVVNVRYPNGSSGRVAGIFWLQNYDALVMRATCCGILSRPPVGWVDVCRCGYYNDFGPSARIPILSMLSAGGGRPVPVDGFLRTDAAGHLGVLLPVAHGTSGTMVVDRQGKLVGLVWGEFSLSGPGGGGFRAAITPAPAIIGLMKYAFEQDGMRYPGP